MSKAPNHGTATTAVSEKHHGWYEVDNLSITMGSTMIVAEAMVEKIYEKFEHELMIKQVES
jgi:hypothetical protein